MSFVSNQLSAVGVQRFITFSYHGFALTLSKVKENFYKGSICRSTNPFLHYSIIPLFLLLISPLSLHDMAWLFDRYIYGVSTVDFAVKGINYYKETDLNTGASTYFTEVTVTCSGWSRADSSDVNMPIELELALNDGTVIDTSWSDSGHDTPAQQTFEFKTNSAPAYARLDPKDKISGDANHANNSLMVHDFLRPVAKWTDRIFAFFQNVLLSTGVLV